MKEFIDKLISKLKELPHAKYDMWIWLIDAEVTIRELAEEYKGGWIACKEEMPSKDGNYLVCDAQGNIYISRYYAGSTTFKRNVGYVAKAWCELPAPYTEGE